MTAREQEARAQALRYLDYAREAVEKRQYVNAHGWLVEAQQAALRALDAVPKEPAGVPRQETARPRPTP